LLGAVPHVLHHVGLITGAAMLTGAAGNVSLFVLGLLFSIPLLRRLYRHFRGWMAPALAVVGFAEMFTFSAVVLGPLITGSATAPATPVPTRRVPASPSPSSPVATDHDAHDSG